MNLWHKRLPAILNMLQDFKDKNVSKCHFSMQYKVIFICIECLIIDNKTWSVLKI